MQKSLKDEIKFLEGKLEKDPNSILFARLADAYLQADRVDEAIELCENSIKKHPFYVTGHYILGKCYLKKKLFDQAERELKRVLLFDPKHLAAHRDYGELMAQIGWNNSCETSYQEILAIDPLNDNARRRLAELRQQALPNREHVPIEEKERTIKEVEEIADSGLGGVPPVIEEEPITPETIDEADFPIPPKTREYFTEIDDQFEEEQANLDLLEDIFRNDATTDLILERDASEPVPPSKPPQFEEKFDIIEPSFGMPGTSPQDLSDEMGMEEFDGFDEGELHELLAEEKPTIEPPAAPEFPRRPVSPPEKSPVPPPPKADSHPDAEADQRKKEKIVTPTLGEIYAAQQQYAKAIGVYEILRKKDPNNEIYKKKIEYLQKKLEESQSRS
ncbi:MAG: tetratricopeptide repeat protein [candidate division KSB1 bacterium]|nr:tetratricopeptide repeat protein [candidate division KSB1 bacterium]MDZ7319304.1 tetratricopeptide repeat protein [candidate division KSB1 bacterium]MDZ7340876.1 tetratricopeptide repeat protein [candidate division KSB1 bacterium]